MGVKAGGEVRKFLELVKEDLESVKTYTSFYIITHNIKVALA